MNKLFNIGEGESGFTLLEVMISLTILVTLSLSLSTLITSSFAIRGAIAEVRETNQNLASVMRMIQQDIEHAFFIESRDLVKLGNRQKNQNTIFKISSFGGGVELRLTTKGRRVMVRDAKESDLTLVSYSVETVDNEKRLMRYAWPRIPVNLEDKAEGQIILSRVSTFSVWGWRGDDWLKDEWNTQSGETKDKLPKLVKVILGSFPPGLDQPERGRSLSRVDLADALSVESIFYLPMAKSFRSLREGNASIAWESL